MTDKQPEALRLAECLDEPDYCTKLQMRQAAAELRRLHEVNAELIRVLRIAYERLPDSDEFDCIAAAVDKAEGK